MSKNDVKRILDDKISLSADMTLTIRLIGDHLVIDAHGVQHEDVPKLLRMALLATADGPVISTSDRDEFDRAVSEDLPTILDSVTRPLESDELDYIFGKIPDGTEH